MKHDVRLVTLTLGLLVALDPAAHAANYTFTPINVPFSGVNYTEADGINGTGDVVGTYADSAGFHGYLNHAGGFSIINVPGATETLPKAINDSGAIVGFYQDRTGVHGFLNQGGSFTTLNVPFPGATNTVANGINGAGAIVGFYQDSGGGHGFLATPGQTSVPEPTSLLLLGSCLAGLALWRQCRPAPWVSKSPSLE